MKMNRDIGIGISTFLRDDSLFRLINSILEYLPEFRIYIVDQGGGANAFKKIFYKGLQKQGHIVKHIPFDSGISKSRWVLKDICKEPYLVFMEDDFQVTSKTNLYKFQEILEENSHLGIVGGNLQGYATTGAYSFFLDYADDKICYFPLDYLVEKNLTQWKETSKGTKFLEASIVSDFTMWKKEVPNIFDENVHTIEHTHVYLLVRYKTKYKVAFCPESEIKHAHDADNKEYNNFRNRKDDLEYLKNYWKIKDFYKFDKHKLRKLEEPLEIKKIDAPNKLEIKIPIVPKIEPKIEEKKIVVDTIPIIKQEIKENPCLSYNNVEVFQILNQHNIEYTLVKETCLNSLCQKDIAQLQICVPSQHQCQLINELFPNHKFCIEIKSFKKIKTHNYRGISVKVPFPVLKYLEKEFNKKWDDLKNGI